MRTRTALTAAVLAGTVSAINLNIDNEQSIKNAAATAAFNTMVNYTGNQTGQIPGYIQGGWWEGGALFQTMIQYWYFTGDTSNNAAVSQGMYWQRGSGDDFMPSNWSLSLTNSDQMLWGLAAMTAAELDYPQESSMPSWVSLADGVFDTQTRRWDNEVCNGGLRDGIQTFDSDYDIKTAMANGGLFQLAARLARFKNTDHYYIGWAEKVWEWSEQVSLVDTKSWRLTEGISTSDGCKSISDLQWTYNYGLYLGGAAYMYNVTGKQTWKKGLDGLLQTTFDTLFPKAYGGNIMSETACEAEDICNSSEDIYKGLLASDLLFVSIVAPYTAESITSRLRGSAVAAAKSCTGGNNNTLCGQRWYNSTWDGTATIEDQMSAVNILTAALASYVHVNTSSPISLNATQSASSIAAAATKSNGAVALTHGSMSTLPLIVVGIISALQGIVYF
ncbi:mannan endo-1-6-alpha-mannosidase [Penicillium lagena]|uniref:mannan endo-1-6-alpha-mannosidase n=1 Tax=Penicillium lagena TaxID=94218 RepID=UPI002540C265|nr:mannan endo-1-6-alpha-mannosidase [Penicillium lagena]KAJ5610722.1 mannan endo-1-6-alpha-mannosidase [Penicillium lagena]